MFWILLIVGFFIWNGFDDQQHEIDQLKRQINNLENDRLY